MSLGVLFAWKVSCFHEKVHNFANFGGCAAIATNNNLRKRPKYINAKTPPSLQQAIKKELIR